MKIDYLMESVNKISELYRTKMQEKENLLEKINELELLFSNKQKTDSLTMKEYKIHEENLKYYKLKNFECTNFIEGVNASREILFQQIK